MSIAEARARLQFAHRDLLGVWFRVRDRWRDENAREFGVRVIEPLDTTLRNAANGMEHMEAQLVKLRKDCEIETKF